MQVVLLFTDLQVKKKLQKKQKLIQIQSMVSQNMQENYLLVKF